MLVKERRCDLCGDVISRHERNEEDSLRLRYKARRYCKTIGYCGYLHYGWKRVDVCQRCLEKIIAKRRSDGGNR